MMSPVSQNDVFGLGYSDHQSLEPKCFLGGRFFVDFDKSNPIVNFLQLGLSVGYDWSILIQEKQTGNNFKHSEQTIEMK